ncbi:hypothetical protein N7462_007330 [Penicillium macrosclerotiorum]|uniref:uncharacterized protein n=1 Tax=Penicillium macrosclerotiorum TaxID=303699 RepID=UPI002546A9FC|nr:uncharacterized protein N7462_007330 [Penicillium macrosclerotiorum]KAJ5679086.1 hypothetical protein N7462_007330 [Penicillium macrosclerotiorum]
MTYALSEGHVARLFGSGKLGIAILEYYAPDSRDTLASFISSLGMNGPRPSTRAFLCDLPCLPADSKIRFLGCVSQYDVITGHLTLEHNYPRSRGEPSSVSVDINAVLADLTSEELRVGSWLNVLGYVRDTNPPVSSFSSSQSNGNEVTQSLPTKVAPRPVYVDAVMVFSAGAIALGEYERILRTVQDVERRIRFST